jgi:hypothetical protein
VSASESAGFRLKTKCIQFIGLVFSFFFTSGFALLAATRQELAIEPFPNWATSIDVKDRNYPLEKEANAGVFFLLFNVEINAATGERFIHVAQKYTSSVGVEANSRLSFTFDPSYQQLILHKILIHRGDRILNQLELDRIRVIQQEKDLDRLIYNGAKTAFLFLEDVRVGDWVEFAYTIRGRNPIETGHFFDALQLRYPFPIQTENYRLLWPRTNQPLWVQISGEPSRNRNVTEKFYEYAWHWENRRGEEFEEFVPSSTIRYALVHFSDYKSWTDVADWAEKSFRAESVSEGLHQKIMQIQAQATDEQRVVKALEFVQDEIRYLGIENGINSHQPTDPSVVFARGYGDCKDKALLFCTILRFFDRVDAIPVLVSSGFKGGVQNFIATPLVFDHAIVRVILNGKTNYLDVTRSFQRGPLDRRFTDYFGAGVLLDENGPGLINIPARDAGTPRTKIEENFDVSTNGATELVVTSSFEGRDADLMRQTLASTSQDLMEKNLLTHYRKYYPRIIPTGRPRLHDDEDFNRLQIRRQYFIPNIWKPALQTNFISCEFASYGIFDRLYIPAKRDRKWPLAIPFPDNFIHTMRIETHESWRITPRDKVIRNKALLFHNRVTSTNNRIEVTSQILPLSSGVAVQDLPEYWAALDEIPRFLGLAIAKPVRGTGQNDSPNWSIWIAGICYCAVLLIGAIMIYRYRHKAPPELCLPSNPDLQGLGGWLILLGIGLLLTPLIRIRLLAKSGVVYSTSSWRTITDPAGGYDSLLAPILLYELFFQLTLLVFSLLLIVLYFRKKRTFPTVLIAYLLFQFVVFTVDEVLVKTRSGKTVTTNARAPAMPAMAQTMVPLIVWGLYVSRSKRVKMTFLN